MVARNFTVSTGYDVRHIINSEYEIRDHVGVFNRVDLERKTCSCKEYDMIGIPCTHTVAAAVNSVLNVDSLAATEYSNAYWLLAYTGSVNPVRVLVLDDVLAGDGMKLLPPTTRRPSGRPSKIPFGGLKEEEGVQQVRRAVSQPCHLHGTNLDPKST
ncbi:hypothetical protein Bca4012_037351 [Brassica carinata]